MGIKCGKITRNALRGGGRQAIETDGYNVKVTISNTAPTESDYPMIVFMGVGLKIQFPGTSHRTIQRMKNESTLNVDRSNVDHSNPFPPDNTVRVDFPDYLPSTQDEQRHGYILFPGHSITYDLG